MTKRVEIVSPKYVLRDMVLKNGGVMGITQILEKKEFRHGYEMPDIQRLVYQLRKDNKGLIGSYGQEAWEIIDNVIFGLENKLTPWLRWRIQKRRHAKEVGSADQTILDNRIFASRVESAEVKEKLDKSSDALQGVRRESSAMTESLAEHREDFEEKETE